VNMDRLSEIKERVQKATKGPWRWNLNDKSKHIYLEACISGFEYVMDFVRWGMCDAIPRFKSGDTMTRACEFGKVVPGHGHHANWFKTIDHPDADFIAHAREDVPWLVS